MFRGNIVMKGYLKNPEATEEAFAGGWFHSGDLGVLHPDGYIQLKDRSKDIIISGRREHLLHRGRGRALQAPRGGGLRRRRQARREVGRDARRLHRAEARRRRHRGGDHRLVPRRTSPATSAPATSSSAKSPRPAPARSRNSCCGSGRGGVEGRYPGNRAIASTSIRNSGFTRRLTTSSVLGGYLPPGKSLGNTAARACMKAGMKSALVM